MMSAGLTLGSLAGLPEVEAAVPALGRVLLSHDDFDVRWRVAGALGRIGTPAAASFLVRGLRDPSFYARDESAWALARCGSIGVAALEPSLAVLPVEIRPFAALALGLSGDGRGEDRAIELLSDTLGAGESAIVRDALYFLGEVAHVPGARRLAPTVASFTQSTCDEVVRAAAWCSGMLATKADDRDSQDERELAELARQHPVETLRFEAVVALGRMALARRNGRLVHEVTRALHEDGAGRVRYAAMQSLRLMASAGMEDLDGAAAHDSDSDFGVIFERELLLKDRTL
jgi:HEAT repeat protein